MFKMIVAAVLLFATTVYADDPRLTISGTGVVTVEPDEGYIVIGFNNVATTSAQSMQTNNQTMKQVFDSIKEFGIEDSDIKTLEFSITPHFVTRVNDKNNAITEQDGFQTSNVIKITVRKLESFGNVIDKLIANGANRVDQITFGSSQKDDFLMQARVLATKDAVKKAKAITEGLNVKLGKVMSVKEFSDPQRTYMRSQSTSDISDGVPVSSGGLTFSVNVMIDWEIVNEN